MSRSLYSGWCLAFTLLYIAAAAYVIWDDRTHTGGGWISLNGMTSYLVSLPVCGFLDALLGVRLDYRRNLDMAFAVLATATIVYFALFGAATLLQTIFTSPAPPPPSPRT